MSNTSIKNHINLYLNITKNSDHSYSYQYLCCMKNGVLVNLEGMIISKATQITVSLTNYTSGGYSIAECLIPCDQKTVTATIDQESINPIVTIIDRDNEAMPKDYNFVIIAINKHTQEQIVCDPQIQNKGTMN